MNKEQVSAIFTEGRKNFKLEAFDRIASLNLPDSREVRLIMEALALVNCGKEYRHKRWGEPIDEFIERVKGVAITESHKAMIIGPSVDASLRSCTVAEIIWLSFPSSEDLREASIHCLGDQSIAVKLDLT